MVLSVLSGAVPVTEAIAQSKITRAAYYKLETRALQAMLAALNPLSTRPVGAGRAVKVADRRIEALEAQVKTLEQGKRRAERLLLLTRKSLQLSGVRGRRGRTPDPGLIPKSQWRSMSLPERVARSVPSTKTPGGAAGS
jgi:hypothetical protein